MAKRRSDDTVLRGVTRACEWMLVIGALGVVLLAVVVPRLAGATPYAVLTGSMDPSMPPGTLVVVRPVDPDGISVGTVITYQPDPDEERVITHRVVGQGFDGLGRATFHTQGDANEAADLGIVHGYQVVGERWYYLPYLGYVTTLLDGAQRRAGILFVAGGLGGYALVMFGGALRDRVRRPPEPSHA